MPRQTTSTISYPKWLHQYMKQVQEELKLGHWNITFENTHCSETSMAEILISPAQHNATVTLSNEWKKWEPHTMRSTIVHELMHCHINPINEIAEEHLQELSPKTLEARKKGLDYVNERVTDALAEMIAPYVTMPTKEKQQSSTYSHTVAYSRTSSSKKATSTKDKKTKKPKKNNIKKQTRTSGKNKRAGK